MCSRIQHHGEPKMHHSHAAFQNGSANSPLTPLSNPYPLHLPLSLPINQFFYKLQNIDLYEYILTSLFDPFFSPRKLLRRFNYDALQQQRSLRMRNTSLRCQTARCGLSYLMLKGVVDVICMLHWCSNSSLNASSAGKGCDCMVGKQTSVSDGISPGLLKKSWFRLTILYHKNFIKFIL